MTAITLPNPDADSAPFWAACLEDRLTVQSCPACRAFRWPPAEYCPQCQHHGGDWIDLPGTGTIAALVVPHRAFDPAFADRVPYIVAHITLDGAAGVNVISNVVGVPAGEVEVGQGVHVEFHAEGPYKLHRFRVIKAAANEEK